VVKAILTHLATRTDGHIVFILWGQVAQRTFDDLGVLAAATAAGTQHRVARNVHPGAEGACGRPLFFNPPNPLREAAEPLAAIGGGKHDW
jgi:uracil DNA glycosylase